jgi:hypothetical protein
VRRCGARNTPPNQAGREAANSLPGNQEGLFGFTRPRGLICRFPMTIVVNRGRDRVPRGKQLLVARDGPAHRELRLRGLTGSRRPRFLAAVSR